MCEVARRSDVRFLACSYNYELLATSSRHPCANVLLIRVVLFIRRVLGLVDED